MAKNLPPKAGPYHKDSVLGTQPHRAKLNMCPIKSLRYRAGTSPDTPPQLVSSMPANHTTSAGACAHGRPKMQPACRRRCPLRSAWAGILRKAFPLGRHCGTAPIPVLPLGYCFVVPAVPATPTAAWVIWQPHRCHDTWKVWRCGALHTLFTRWVMRVLQPVAGHSSWAAAQERQHT